jgi:broad specificity phosphatase PhoE
LIPSGRDFPSRESANENDYPHSFSRKWNRFNLLSIQNMSAFNSFNGESDLGSRFPQTKSDPSGSRFLFRESASHERELKPTAGQSPDFLSKTTVVWIRHAIKEYNNGYGPAGSYAHDSPIKCDQIENAFKRGHDLILKYGVPNVVYVSPYLRTRQTMNLLTASVAPIAYIDRNVGEFLGHQGVYGEDGDCYPETLRCNPPKCRETMNELIFRCNLHLQSTLRLSYDMTPPLSGTIWVVTHGLVIRTIRKILCTNPFITDISDAQIDELDALVLQIPGSHPNILSSDHFSE